MTVEPRIQGEKDRAANFGVWTTCSEASHGSHVTGQLTGISDSNSQKLLDDFADHLDGVRAGLMHDGIANKELAACQGRRLANLGLLVFDIVDGDVMDEFVQDVSLQPSR